MMGGEHPKTGVHRLARLTSSRVIDFTSPLLHHQVGSLRSAAWAFFMLELPPEFEIEASF
jgi:hypothetical protein